MLMHLAAPIRLTSSLPVTCTKQYNSETLVDATTEIQINVHHGDLAPANGTYSTHLKTIEIHLFGTFVRSVTIDSDGEPVLEYRSEKTGQLHFQLHAKKLIENTFQDHVAAYLTGATDVNPLD